MDSYNSYKVDSKEKFVPFKKYSFGAGDLGADIRLSIPLSASQEDVRAAAQMIMTLADNWKGLNG